MNQADYEVEEILHRIQELEILQQALQQMNETLELFLKPQPKKLFLNRNPKRSHRND